MHSMSDGFVPEAAYAAPETKPSSLGWQSKYDRTPRRRARGYMCWVAVEGFFLARVRVESGVIEVEGRTWYCSGDGECVNVT